MVKCLLNLAKLNSCALTKFMNIKISKKLLNTYFHLIYIIIKQFILLIILSEFNVNQLLDSKLLLFKTF